MAVAFNPSEEVREGAHHVHNQHQHVNNSASGAAQPPPPPEPPSDTSTPSSSTSSSANSSPGAVTGHPGMSMPQAHQGYPQGYAPMFYYAATASSPLAAPQSPVPPPPPTATVYRQYNNEELIQAICEALHRCSNGQMPPPSPSCSPFVHPNVPLTPFAVYGQSAATNPAETNVFFPQNMPATPVHGYYAQQTPQSPIPSHPSYYSLPQQQPLYFQYHNILPNSPYAPSVTPMSPAPVQPAATPSAMNPSPVTQQPQLPRRAARRIRLSSRSEASPSTSHPSHPADSSESEVDPVLCIESDKFAKIIDTNNNNRSASSDSDSALHDHLSYYLEARERLEEFPGRVPQRRKKSATGSSSSSSQTVSNSTTDSPNATPQKQSQQRQNKPSDLQSKDTTPLLSAGDQGSSSSSSFEQKTKIKSTEQCLSWSLLTAFVLVVGCGFFASR